ncbi:MAG: 3'(2'),5'-bisphosphate nucleotidase CysQ [Pseudomonadota bacterium]
MPAPKSEDVALLIDAAERAGDIALRHFSGDRTPTQKPGGQGPVTDADLEVDAALRTQLLAARPGYGWLSEETPDNAARLACEHVFIIDPIDGTRAFVDGRKSWAHSLAIVRGGAVVAAVVFLPALERMYVAGLGDGAQLNGARIEVDPGANEGDEILAARPNFSDDRWPGGVTPMRRAFRSSLANRLALVAEARFAAMLSLREVWDWDVAAGALLVTEAGGNASTPTGASLNFNQEHAMQPGILAAPRQLHQQLVARLTPPAA